MQTSLELGKVMPFCYLAVGTGMIYKFNPPESFMHKRKNEEKSMSVRN